MDAWDELRAELGKRAGDDFLRRLRATKDGRIALVVNRARSKTESKWVEPPERIVDEDAPEGAQSGSTQAPG